MTASASSAGGRTLRLPVWVVALLMLAGLLSVALAGGSFWTFVALALFAVNVYGAVVNFGAEVKHLAGAHVGHGPVDKAALRKDAMGALPTPLWLVATLVVGSIWTAILIAKVIGLVIAVVMVVGLLALIGFGAYKAAKKAGMLDD